MSAPVDSSEPVSEAESSSESFELGPEVVRQLRSDLEEERRQNKNLLAKLKRATKLNEQLQTQAEKEEEYITNKLMKRLDELKKEKEHLARQVEMEEENITNKLSKKLEKVKQEKVTLENLLEQEQEYIVNKLQKQLGALHEEKRALEAQLREGTDTILQTLHAHLERWRSGSSSLPERRVSGNDTSAPLSVLAPPSLTSSPPLTPASPGKSHQLPNLPFSPGSRGIVSPRVSASASSSVGVPSLTTMTGLAMGLPPDEARGELERTHVLVSHLASEIDALGQAQERYRRECEQQHQEAEALREELARLQADNAGLVNRVAREREIRERAQKEKARLQQEIECDSERLFNSCTCSGRSSVPGSPALTSTPGLFFPNPPASPHGCAPASPLHSLLLPGAAPGFAGGFSVGNMPMGTLSPRPGSRPSSSVSFGFPQSSMPVPDPKRDTA